MNAKSAKENLLKIHGQKYVELVLTNVEQAVAAGRDNCTLYQIPSRTLLQFVINEIKSKGYSAKESRTMDRGNDYGIDVSW